MNPHTPPIPSPGGHVPPLGHGPHMSRRGALRSLGWIGAWATAHGAVALESSPAPSPALPDPALRLHEAENYWTQVRAEQFLLGEKRSFLNPGSLGVMPRPVLQKVIESQTRQAEWPTDDLPRWGYETLEDERAEMAQFLGCEREELAFTHNCTEAISYVAAGLELKSGDEVLMTNQEHPGGSSGWKIRAARSGIVVREVEIPVSPNEPGELAERMISAIGPKTRVLSFSGITSPTGLVMPVAEICRAARNQGVLTLVDGAHMDGQIPVNLRELGCDFFAGSPHKWMFAPAGCGLLYGRNEALDRLWPSVCNSGWDNPAGLHATRFMMIGTNNRSIIDGMMAGLRFLKALGPEAVYARQHQLAQLIQRRTHERSYLEPVTSDDSRLFRAIYTLRFKQSELSALFKTMKERQIYIVGGQRQRLSANIYTRPSDIDAFFEVCDQHLKR